MTDNEVITEEVQKIHASGFLGRSRAYVRLLDYLADCSIEGRRAKEFEIATDVFDKGGDFDSNQDSLVRVYIHNLRQKLDNYYESVPAGGNRLGIPKGEYRLVVATPQIPDTIPPQTTVWSARFVLLAALLVANLGAVTFFIVTRESGEAYRGIADSPIWVGLLGSDKPLLVVVGDYYIFAELDEAGNVTRMVREFDVNSSADLDAKLIFDPTRQADIMDLDLTYLPQSTAFALKDLLRIVYTTAKPVSVTPVSRLRAADLKTNDILYVGYISALGPLLDFAFASSSLSIGATYDELLNRKTGIRYTSNAGLAGQSNYRDYGWISTFPGPNENQFLIVAGTRDSGLMHTAQALATRADIDALERTNIGTESKPAFEALFEVSGFDRMNLDATLVHSSTLNYQEIWGGAINTHTFAE